MAAEPRFLPFMRLPLELRQQIWEMSVDPREIVFGQLHDVDTNKNSSHQKRPRWAPPPPLLTTCAEARSHMQRFYTKTYLPPAYAPQTPTEYCWVHLDADTVHLADRQLHAFSHTASARKLVVETRGGHFDRSYTRFFLRPDLALEELTILDLGSSPKESWWFPWISYMEMFYYGCDAVTFDMRVMHDGLEPLTRDNWLQVDRAWRKKMLDQIFGGHPELREEAEQGDYNEDEDGPRVTMCRRSWRHVEWCACPNKKKAPVNK